MKKIPDNLQDIDDIKFFREKEITKMFSPHFGAIKNYKTLFLHLIVILGKNTPSNDKDRTIRNFIADSYDIIDSAAQAISEGKHNVASVVIRRLYENTSLINAFILNDDIHNRWFQGHEITNKEVRNELKKSTFGADIESTKYIYYFLSDLAHPSRVAIIDRFLGENNEFTLGGFSTPIVSLLAEILVKTLSLVFWFGALVTLFYKNIWSKTDSDFRALYEHVSTHALKINQELFIQLDRLHTEDGFKPLIKP